MYIFMKKLNFGGHVWRHLEFLKTLKSAEPAPDEILKSKVSPSENIKSFTIHLHATYFWVSSRLIKETNKNIV